jgi:uncharacterized membrane protein
MARALAAASMVWPLVLGAAVWPPTAVRHPVATSLVYAVASRICHQRPERSFHSGGVQWPVCARCSGLYLAAPVGALAGLVSIARRRPARRRLWWLVAAAVPTAVTFGAEVLGLAAPSNLTRAVAALPLGAMIAFVLVRVGAGESAAIE